MIITEKNRFFSVFDPLMLSCFLMLVAAVLSNLTSYKVIQIFGTEASLGTFTMPLILMFMNPIAEVYGREKSNQVLISLCVMEFVFSISFTALGFIKKNCDLLDVHDVRARCEAINLAYTLVGSNIIRGAVSFSVGCLFGSYFNTKFLLYLKKLWSSEKYFIRDIFSSLIGEIIYTAICFTLAFYGIFPFYTILKIFIFSLMFKISATLVLSYISKFLVTLLVHHKSWLAAGTAIRKIKFSSRDIQYEKN